MHITLRQLQILEAVASTGNLSRASETLHLTQPAVSMQIKNMEDTLAITLLERTGKRVFLTDAGREVQRASLDIAERLAQLKGTIDAMKGLQHGSIVVGVVSTASAFSIRLIALFRHRYPGIYIRLNVINREELLQQLTNNSLDLAIMGQPPAHLEIDDTVFMDNPLIIIAPPHHPLSGKTNIPLSRIAEEPFLGRESGSGTRIATEAFFQAHRIAWKVDMEMNKNEAIKLAVEAGLGLSVVSRHTVLQELAAKRLCILQVEGFPIIRSWHLVKRKNKQFSGSTQAFAEFILQEARNIERIK